MTKLEDLKKNIMRDVYEKRMILTSVRDRPEGWTLHSGMWSPFYIQLRVLSSFPETLKLVGNALSILIKEEAPSVNRLVGIAFAGIPIATAVSLESGIPACHTRKILGVRTEQELYDTIGKYGQHSLMEGEVQDGDVLCLVDDLVTGMESKLVGRAQVLAELKKRNISDVSVDDIAVIIDRQQGARERAKGMKIRLHSLIDLVDEGLPLIQDSMSEEEFQIVSDYLLDTTSIKKT
ncbi:MAG: orotate phosphoribosyltransferase [Candidatus Thorarchaeota archaeon]